jgi:CheY-like chemotaxis protein
LLGEAINNEWNIVICDMNMPGRSGLDALIQLKTGGATFAGADYEYVS